MRKLNRSKHRISIPLPNALDKLTNSLNTQRWNVSNSHYPNMNQQPVGLANDLAPLQVMRSTVGQHDIAVWRSSSGVVSAWENRCPHRGMRLSYGFVRGESLACAYHGWHYNCSGECHYIPAHPELTPPKSIRPSIFSVMEHAGLLWVDVSEEAQLAHTGVERSSVQSALSVQSAPPLVNLPHDLHPLRTVSIDCEPERLISVLSDIAAPGSTGEKVMMKTVCEQVRIFSFDAMGTANGVYLVLHTPPAQSMLVHVLVQATLNVEERIVVSRWCESLRRLAESQ